MTAQAMDLNHLTIADVRDILIQVYVPEAEQMPYDDALKMAFERDQIAAQELAEDYTQLQLEKSAAKARLLDQEAAFDSHFVDMCM
jgi:hypothetical protein